MSVVPVDVANMTPTKCEVVPAPGVPKLWGTSQRARQADRVEPAMSQVTTPTEPGWLPDPSGRLDPNDPKKRGFDGSPGCCYYVCLHHAAHAGDADR